MTKILIACLENWDSIAEIPYVLNKGGCTIDAFCSKESWLIKNSFYHNWIDSDLSLNYCEELVNVVTTGQYDWVILGDEPLLKKMNEFIKTENLFRKVLPLSKIGNRHILGSKIGLAKLCEKYCINAPKSVLIEKSEHINLIDCPLRFPVLIKIDYSWGGSGIFLCEDLNNLKYQIQKFSKETRCVIQEFIKGIDIGIECLFKEGALLTYNCSEVIEYKVNQFQATTKRKYFNNNEIEELIKKIGKDIGINGFASIQLIYNILEMKYYVIEVDLRPQAWIRYGKFTGNDFSIGVKRFTGQLPIKSSCYNVENDSDKKSMELFLFHRIFMNFFLNKKLSGISSLIFNTRNWKFIPFYDLVYMKYILKDVYLIIYNRVIRTFKGKGIKSQLFF